MTYSPEMKETMSMTAATLGKDLLAALVGEMRLLPELWHKLPQTKQDDVIERLRKRVDDNVKMAVHLIASNGRTVVQGDLEQITIKDGAKAVIKIGRHAESLHELYEAQGHAVLIVVSGAEEHTGGMDEIRGESDQRAMDLGKEYTDQDGDGMEDQPQAPEDVIDVLALPAPPDEIERDPLYAEAATLVVREQKCSITFLQRRLSIGYNRAARILEQLEAAGVVSAPDANGSRSILFDNPDAA